MLAIKKQVREAPPRTRAHLSRNTSQYAEYTYTNPITEHPNKMQTENHIWYLKQNCPCCDQAFVSLVSCPDCNYVTARCEETGDTFLDAENLNYGLAQLCPGCKKVQTDDFEHASLESIQTARISRDSYH
jgi:phage FluMu protein Com